MLPVVLSYIIRVSYHWPWCVFLCHPMCVCAGGGGGVSKGPQRANPAGKSELSLSLCVIQYHACVPMNGCQDIRVQSQETSHSQGFSEDQTGWGWAAALTNTHAHTHTHSICTEKKKEKYWNYKIKSLKNKYSLDQNSNKNRADFKK